MFHYTQFFMWIIKSGVDYFLLKRVCRLQEKRSWMIALRVFFVACVMLSTWSIHGSPFLVGWVWQVFWDMVMIFELRDRNNLGIVMGRQLVYVCGLESGWLLSVCIFWRWSASLFVQQGRLLYAILGMISTLVLSGFLFLCLARIKSENIDLKTGLALIGVMFLNVLSAQNFIDLGANNWCFILVIALYTVLLIIGMQFITHQSSLQQREYELQSEQFKIVEATKQLEEDSEQLREVRHSLKDHLRIIQMLNRENNREEIERYITGIIGECDEHTYHIYCTDPLLNAFFNQIVADHSEIHFDFLIDSKIEKMPKEFVEAIFLANDNAVDELQRHPELAQMITVSIRQEKDKVIGIIRNPLSSEKSLQTEKQTPDHGIGLKRMKKIIKDLDGTIDIMQNEYFVVTMTVPNRV